MRVRDTLHQRKAPKPGKWIEPQDIMKIQRVSERFCDCDTHPVRFFIFYHLGAENKSVRRDFKDLRYEEHRPDEAS